MTLFFSSVFRPQLSYSHPFLSPLAHPRVTSTLHVIYPPKIKTLSGLFRITQAFVLLPTGSASSEANLFISLEKNIKYTKHFNEIRFMYIKYIYINKMIHLQL